MLLQSFEQIVRPQSAEDADQMVKCPTLKRYMSIHLLTVLSEFMLSFLQLFDISFPSERSLANGTCGKRKKKTIDFQSKKTCSYPSFPNNLLYKVRLLPVLNLSFYIRETRRVIFTVYSYYKDRLKLCIQSTQYSVCHTKSATYMLPSSP